MQFDIKLFEKLEAERKALETRLFQIEVAIDSLQGLCIHEWESAGFLVDQYENPTCKHCGKPHEQVKENV